MRSLRWTGGQTTGPAAEEPDWAKSGFGIVDWTAGIGGEYAFTNFLTGFAEYNYYDFGTRTNTFTCTVAVCGAVTFPVDVKETKSVVKVGLNFKFGPTAPLVGKY